MMMLSFINVLNVGLPTNKLALLDVVARFSKYQSRLITVLQLQKPCYAANYFVCGTIQKISLVTRILLQ